MNGPSTLESKRGGFPTKSSHRQTLSLTQRTNGLKVRNDEKPQITHFNHAKPKFLNVKNIDQNNYLSETQKYDLKIPRFFKVTNRIEDNDLDLIKTKLRKNKIDHLNFNAALENNEGRRYFSGVYVPNEPEEVFEFDDEFDLKDIETGAIEYPTQNLYDYIIKNNL